MGIVTDVEWDCPKCGKKNIAQLYGDYYPDDYFDRDGKPEPLSHRAIPSCASLKWNPPCEGCGEYQLSNPVVTLVEFPISRVTDI